jgi:general secretion pathway protein K
MTRRHERGYAMIAAVAAVAAFGYLALSAISSGRSAVVAARAGLTRAKLSADADAGVALAIHQLGLSDPVHRWSVVGPPRQVDFDGARLMITVEDENGKIPLNFVPSSQLRLLFERAGADPRQIDGLVASLLELRGDPKPAGGGGTGVADIDPRIETQRGPLSSVDELRLLPGMTPALYARIAPAVTVHATTLSFDPRTASPLALAVMAPGNASSPSAIDQARERDGETPAETLAPPTPLAGRIVTVRVDASDGHGGAFRRIAVVEFTDARARPYVMRGIE